MDIEKLLEDLNEDSIHWDIFNDKRKKAIRPDIEPEYSLEDILDSEKFKEKMESEE